MESFNRVPFKRQELLGTGGNAQVHRVTFTDPKTGQSFDKALREELVQGRSATFGNAETVVGAKAKRIRNSLAAEAYGTVRDSNDYQKRAPAELMPIVTTGSLDNQIDRGDYLTAAQTAVLMTKISQTVKDAADEGIIHRDIKPGNVLYDRRTQDVKVADWDEAIAIGDEDPMLFGIPENRMRGTPYFMAPEVARRLGDKTTNQVPREVFAIGATGATAMRGYTQRPAPPSLDDLTIEAEQNPNDQALQWKLINKSNEWVRTSTIEPVGHPAMDQIITRSTDMKPQNRPTPAKLMAYLARFPETHEHHSDQDRHDMLVVISGGYGSADHQEQQMLWDSAQALDKSVTDPVQRDMLQDFFQDNEKPDPNAQQRGFMSAMRSLFRSSR